MGAGYHGGFGNTKGDRDRKSIISGVAGSSGRNSQQEVTISSVPLKGGAKFFRSIGQNVLFISNQYHFKQGFFGQNSVHGNNSTRIIASNDNLATANYFYEKIAFGGQETILNSNTRKARMYDGSVITMRIKSNSDGTPVVDINIKNSTHTGGVKTQKIHFIVGGII